MKRPPWIPVILTVVVLVAGFGVYWEWLKLAPQSAASGCPSAAGGLGGAPPIVFILNPRASWTWWQGASGYTYNVTLESVAPTGSTNWTGFDLINRTFHHSLTGYTVTLRGTARGAIALFNSTQSSWRSDSGLTPSEALDNWTPVTGSPIVSTDVLQFQSASNLTASGLYINMEMGSGTCGSWEEQPFIV